VVAVARDRYSVPAQRDGRNKRGAKAVASGQRDIRDMVLTHCPVRPGLWPSFAGHSRDICPGCPVMSVMATGGALRTGVGVFTGMVWALPTVPPPTAGRR
jgi:hypothetical protein